MGSQGFSGGVSGVPYEATGIPMRGGHQESVEWIK